MKKEISEALTKDLGKSDGVNSMYEFGGLFGELDHTIAELKNWVQDKRVDHPLTLTPGKSYIQYEPLGVVTILGSWNFPLATAFAPLIPAIAAGNCVVLKTSEMAPWTAKVVKTFFARHLDLSAYQCVFGGVQVAIRLTSSPFDKICFTGSTEKGKLVAAAAAKNLVPCILELGGKSPAIVDKSCNLDFTCKKIATMSFLNAGQFCIRSDYVLVEYSMVNKFVETMSKYLD